MSQPARLLCLLRLTASVHVPWAGTRLPLLSTAGMARLQGGEKGVELKPQAGARWPQVTELGTGATATRISQDTWDPRC